ncbi:hypothetical protein D9756_007666 [Leucocoprinus leucothites]|uniref:Uncharacterized protein n=1 Tax=Leucocoprinus leucothites TaxID=201217 RepID=A0A8H5D2E1_9AGAR|nr:hypothetical protein D9756_007666 [Leucoagaricus leucothites]
MTISSESDRQRYAQELAAYTLRQFSAARSSADPAKLVKATASTSQQKHQQRTNKAPGTLGETSGIARA